MDRMAALFDTLLGLSATRPEQLSVAQVCLRAALVYLVLIGYLRFGKKRFLGEATALDAILVIVIGSTASRAITGSAPFGSTLAGSFVLIVVHWVMSYLTERSPGLSRLTKGAATTLVQRGRVDRKALRAEHMSDEDLDEELRQHGIDDARQIKEARLERSGRLSVIRGTSKKHRSA
jgi:uncharacterized membrane protein YcaP (DUF421 family)